MKKVMDVSIIIVNWNTVGLLVQCLESIYESGSHYEFEIIVVDNGSTDESVSAVAQQFPAVILIQNERNFGFARANNQGLAIGKGRYVMLLNSDTIVLPGCVDTLIQVADSHPEVGVLGPKLLNKDGSLQKSWASFPSLVSELVGKNFRFRERVSDCPSFYNVDWIMGACMLVRSEVVASVGTMDDAFFFYSEEADWCYRIKKKNWEIWYITNAELYHLGGGSTSRGSLMQFTLLYRSKLIYFSKHHGVFKTTLLRYGLAAVNTLGVMRRLLLFNWGNRVAAWQRIKNQSKLVWCLIRDQYPEYRPEQQAGL